MIDISNEIAGLQAATTGSQIRSAIINALSALNQDLPDAYSGSYYVQPSTSGYFLSVEGLAMTDDLYIMPYPLTSYWSGTESAYSALSSYQSNIVYLVTSSWASQIDKIYIGSSLLWPIS